ncbi:MAG: type II toxin-antitoxin system VapC family toxin [Chloroflexi bacterium]|nr:type II toxin-antitoxin system VapC family toxin [Chloroflexota bacterium]
MARRPLVLDASALVKWYSAVGEGGVVEAVGLMERHGYGELLVTVPELAYYEVANSLVHKTRLSLETVQTAVGDMFRLGLQAVAMDDELMAESVRLARDLHVTVYDAAYIAVARKYACPLVTANPRHQGRDVGCRVIPIEEWPLDAG